MSVIDYRSLAQWAISTATGISSRALAAQLADLPQPDMWRTANHPRDGADLVRCFHLLQAVPSLRPRLKQIEGMNPVWVRLLAQWDALEALYLACDTVETSGDDWQRYRTAVRNVIYTTD